MSVKAKTEDLEVFLAVVDSGSFSAASRLLGIHVASVSRAVSRLESALDITLLNRTTRRLELSEEGHYYASRAREGLTLIESAENELRQLHKKPAGKLRVDAASPFMLHQITPLIDGFNQHYPDIRLELTSNDNVIDLLEHRTDVAIRIGDPKDSNMHYRMLGRSKLRLVASQAYLDKAGSPEYIDSLALHSKIGFTDAPFLNDWFLPNSIPLTFSVAASSGETVRSLCLNGQGIALLSDFMIMNDIESGRLIEVLPGCVQSPNRRESVQAVYYKHGAISSRVSVFLDYIQPRLKL